MTEKWRKRLAEVLGEELAGRAVIAGGYAANPGRATDADVWILESHQTEEELGDIKRRIVRAGLGWSAPQVHGDYPNDFLVVRTFKVGEIENFLPVQLILSREQNPETLLRSFDISTHLWAEKLVLPVEVDGVPYRWRLPESHSTLSGVAARVTNFTTPRATLGRLLKVAKRYNQTIDPEDLQKLLTGSGLEIDENYEISQAA